jgi:hypothetical protein
LCQVTSFFSWLASPLSIGKAAMFGMYILKYYIANKFTYHCQLGVGWTALSVTAAVCRQPNLLDDHCERNLVGIRGACPSTVLNHLCAFRQLFLWRKKKAEFAEELHLIRGPDFASDITNMIDRLYVSCYFYFFH